MTTTRLFLCYVMFMFVVFKLKTQEANVSAISEICALHSTIEWRKNCALDRKAYVYL